MPPKKKPSSKQAPSPQLTLWEPPPLVTNIIASLPADQQPGSYLMAHLLATGFNGSEYQLLVLLFRIITLLNNEQAFEAVTEIDGYGNLDDIGLIIKNQEGEVCRVEAYQVKYYNHAITAHDFFNAKSEEAQAQAQDKKKTSKTEKMHIGKFFDGWLSWRAAYPTLAAPNLLSIVYSNAELDAILTQCIDNTSCFTNAFILHQQRIILARQTSKVGIVHKNFLEKAQITTGHYSKKIWGALHNRGYIDDEGQFTNLYTPAQPGFQLNLPQGTLPAGVRIAQVQATLAPLYNAYIQNQTDLYDLLAQEAWRYLDKKKRHDLIREKNLAEKTQLFQEFLRSFRFQISQNAIEQIEIDIQERILQLRQNNESPRQIFLCLYYAIRVWFRNEATKSKKEKLTPLIMHKLIQASAISSHHLAVLQGYTRAVLADISYTCAGERINPAALEPLHKTLKQPGVVMVAGPKGIGKSGLIKLALEKRHPPEYLAFSATLLLKDDFLQKTLSEVLPKVACIKIIAIDRAEALLKLTPKTLQDFLALMQSMNRTVILALTPEALQHSALKFKRTLITVKPFTQESVIDRFPILLPYEHIQPLMRLAQVPFYLNSIVHLIEQLGDTRFQAVVHADHVSLEAELIKLVLEGQDSSQVKQRRNTVRKLAIKIAKSPQNINHEIALKGSTELTALTQEGFLLYQEGKYRFSHDLFFEHALINAWHLAWKNADTNDKTAKFWNKFNKFLVNPEIVFIFEKWVALYAKELTPDIIASLLTLKTQPYFSSIIALAFVTHNEELFRHFLTSRDIPLNDPLYNIRGYGSATAILLTIWLNYPEGLKILLAQGALPHHPRAGQLEQDITYRSVSYNFQVAPPAPTVVDLTASSDSNSDQSSTHSSDEESSDESSENSADATHSSGSNSEEDAEDDDWEYIYDSETGNWVYPDDCSESEPDLFNDNNNEDEHAREAAELIKSFANGTYKYWSAGFDEEPGFPDDDGEWIENPRYQEPRCYELYYLHQAAIHNRPECLSILLDIYEEKQQTQAIHLTNNYAETALHLAALNGATAVMACLIERNADIDRTDSWGETPLHNATYANDISAAALLLEHGANPNSLNELGLSSLHIALVNLNLEMVKLLFSYGAELTSRAFTAIGARLSAADLLAEISLHTHKHDEMEEFVLQLIELLNFGDSKEEYFVWGNQCDKVNEKVRRKQYRQVDDLMTLVEHRAQLSEHFPGFDYHDDESELEYAIDHGIDEKILYCIETILNDPDWIAAVLEADTFDESTKKEFIDQWFEDLNQKQYQNLKEYAEEYEDSELLQRILDDLALLDINDTENPQTEKTEKISTKVDTKNSKAKTVSSMPSASSVTKAPNMFGLFSSPLPSSSSTFAQPPQQPFSSLQTAPTLLAAPRRDTHLYRSNEIEQLFRLLTQEYGNAEMIAPVLGTIHRDANNELADILPHWQENRHVDLSRGIPQSERVLVPVNTNKNHWVLVYFIMPADGTVPTAVHYFDPFGGAILKSIVATIRLLGFQGDINIIGAAVQTDDYNCGPWIVATAGSLLRTNTTLPPNFNITEARALQQENLRAQHNPPHPQN